MIVAGAEVGHAHHVLDVGQSGGDGSQVAGAVDVFAAVAVAVHGQQHLGVDLAEPVDHRPHAGLGGTARPHRTQRGGGQHGDEGFGNVGKVAGDPIAGPNAQPLQSLGAARYLVGQLGPRQLDGGAGLAAGHHGDVVGSGGSGSQGPVGVVEGGTGKPAGAGHGGVGQGHTVDRWGHPAHTGVGGGGPPEVVGVGQRPRQQLVEGGHALAGGQTAHGRGGQGVGFGLPQHVTMAGHRAAPTPGWVIDCTRLTAHIESPYAPACDC